MNGKMHGKLIAHIDLHCDCNGNPNCIITPRDGVLSLSATYHGDHEQFWVVQTKDGKEVARYQARALDRIVWAD